MPGFLGYVNANIQRQKWSWLYIGVMMVIWLIPFFQTGWKGRSWLVFPDWWSFQHSAAGLFTQRTPVWWDHHWEGRPLMSEREDAKSVKASGKEQQPSALDQGSGVDNAAEGGRSLGTDVEREGYLELPERAFFPMGAFGYRTRLDRILNESHRSRVREAVRERLARHVFDKERELHEMWQNADGVERRPAEPTLPQLQELRLVRSLWRVGTPDMAQPAGAWDPPPVTELPDGQRLVLGAWQREEDGTVLALKVEPDRKVRSAGSPGLAGSGASVVRDARAPGVKVANERIRAALALQARLRSQRQQSGQASGGRISPLESATPHSGNAVGGKLPNAGRETQPILQENGAAVPAVPAPDGRAARPPVPSSVVRPPGSMRPLPRPPLPIRGAAGAPLPEKQGEGK